jgi:hypothetical protein
MAALTNEELIDIFSRQLPALLEERPELEPQLYYFFLKAFVRKEEVAALGKQVENFHAETRANFEQVDQRFEQVDRRFEQVDQRITEFQAETRANFERVDQRFEQIDQRFEQVDYRFEQVDREFEKLRVEMAEGFKEVTRQIDRLGARWGIRNEALFRATMASLLEKSFGVAVTTRHLQGEQFDLIISNGQHILVEIAASVRHNIQERLERKRQIYTETVGVTPSRMILVVATIHSRLAQSLREAGFEVIEPEEDETLPEA